MANLLFRINFSNKGINFIFKMSLILFDFILNINSQNAQGEKTSSSSHSFETLIHIHSLIFNIHAFDTI